MEFGSCVVRDEASGRDGLGCRVWVTQSRLLTCHGAEEGVR